MAIFQAPYLVIQEGEYEFLYGRMMDGNGLPNYYPPQSKYEGTKDFMLDEIIFIPVDASLVTPETEQPQIGYRYLISTTKHQTISLGPDPLQLGVSNVEMTVELHRFVFKTIDQRKIQIVEVGDSLYPPRIITMETPTKQVAQEVQNTVRTMVTNYNNWYLNRNI